MNRERDICPYCGDETDADEIGRFSMCLDCFADGIQSDVTESILYDFLRDHSREFRDYIMDNYEG